MDLKWSKSEKQVAREAYNKAYEREMFLIRHEVIQQVQAFQDKNDVWKLHDYLTDKRKEIDEKYDYRC